MPPRIPPNLNSPGLEGGEFPDTSLEPQLEPGEKDSEIEYVDSSAQLWAVVFKESEKYDKTLVESWKGDMDGILFFTGLFSATVAAFIIDGYKYLIRNSADTTNQLLTQITQQLTASAAGSDPPLPFALPPFDVPTAMLRVNILWFLSLSLSVACALVATLVQQWARNYLLTTQLPSSPQRRARVRTYLFQGVQRFRLGTVVNTVPVLLHASVFLFFAGLVQFLFQVNNSLAYAVLCCVIVYAKAYVALTLLPLFRRDCPYLTPMSGPLWRTFQALQLAAIFSFRHVCKILMPTRMLRLMNLKEYMCKCKERFFGGLQYDLERCATDASQELDTFALRWTLKSLREPSELESFIAGIPGFLGSATITSDAPQLTPSSITLYNLLHVADVYLGLRLGHLLKTQLHTPLPCVDALWHITRWYDVVNVPQWDRAFGEATLDSLHALRGSRDVAIALTARCAAALCARVVLKDLRCILELDPTKKLRIMELRKVVQALMDAERPDVESLPDDEFIRKGHMLNIADVLTGVMPLLPGVDGSRANVLWDTLDMLCAGLDPNPVSSGIQTAMVEVRNAYEVGLRDWESAPSMFSRQPPGSLGHYHSRMQETVGSIIGLITGATEG